MEGVLNVRGLVRLYGSVRAVKEAELTVESGKITSVLGASGCGKTTLMRLICGLDRASAGSITLLGKELTSLGDGGFARVRMKNIGTVCSEPGLIDSITLAENAALPLMAAGVTGGKRIKRARALFKTLNIDHTAGMYPKAAGALNKVCAALARAMISSPAVIIADDFTRTLGEREEKIALGLLTDYAQASECGILLLTDNPETAKLADKKYTMEHGKTQEVSQ